MSSTLLMKKPTNRNSVLTEKLLETLSKSVIPKRIISWLYECLKSPSFILITEARTLTINKSARGCPLSPIVFNLNRHAARSACLTGIANWWIRWWFCGHCQRRIFEISGRRPLSNFLEKVQHRLTDLNLSVGTEKSAVEPFNRKCIKHLKMCGTLSGHLSLLNTHKYSRFILDKQVKHKKQAYWSSTK